MEKKKILEPDESIFDQTAFLEWLEAQPPGAIVGLAGIACDCPLAQWLESLGYQVRIGGKRADFYHNGRKEIDLPAWVIWFTTTVDIAGFNTPCIRERTIEIVKGIKCPT